MKSLVSITAFTLSVISMMFADGAIAFSDDRSSTTDSVLPTSKPLNNQTVEGTPTLKPDALQRDEQPSDRQESETNGMTHSNRLYPAYCDAYIVNSIPGSWQFEQDIQRCIHGGG